MVTYRKATIDDLENLVQLRTVFMKEFNNIDSQLLSDQFQKEMKSYLIKALPNQAFVAWLAEEDGKIIGTSGLSFYEIPPSFMNLSGKIAYILNMYTVPTFRGKGIAKTLFGKIVEEAKQRGYEVITLNASDMGRPLYEKFGFIDHEGEMILKLSEY